MKDKTKIRLAVVGFAILLIFFSWLIIAFLQGGFDELEPIKQTISGTLVDLSWNDENDTVFIYLENNGSFNLHLDSYLRPFIEEGVLQRWHTYRFELYKERDEDVIWYCTSIEEWM